MANLAFTYGALGRLAQAVELTEETVRLQKATLGPDHDDTIMSLDSLGLYYLTQRRREEGFVLLEEALRHRQRRFGPKHPDTLRGTSHLAEAHLALGRNEE